MSKLQPILDRLLEKRQPAAPTKAEMYSSWESQMKAILRFNSRSITEDDFLIIRDELRVHLLSKRLLGVDVFTPEVDFHGYGDSGQMENGSGSEILDDFFNLCQERFVHFDWYNNEGGNVSMEWNLDTDKIVIHGYQNVMTTSTAMDGEEF